jgi:Flp pilus assembly protein CpaB
MNKNGVIAVVVVVISIVLIGLWAMRAGEAPAGADCSAPPEPPTNLRASVQGNKGQLSWTPPAAGEPVTTYIIEAGSSPGANNQGTFVAPATTTTFEREAAAGTYYVRMYARNACGTSAASEEITVTFQ